MAKRILAALIVTAVFVLGFYGTSMAQDAKQCLIGVVVENTIEGTHYELETGTGTYVLQGADFSQFVGKVVTVEGTLEDVMGIFMRGQILAVTSIEVTDDQTLADEIAKRFRPGENEEPVGTGILPTEDLGYSHWSVASILFIKNYGAFGSGMPQEKELDQPVTPERFAEWAKTVLNLTSELEVSTLKGALPAVTGQSFIERKHAVAALLQVLGLKGAVLKETGGEAFANAAAQYAHCDQLLGYRDIHQLGALGESAGLLSAAQGFRPDDPLTVAEAATMLRRAAARYDVSRTVLGQNEQYRKAALAHETVSKWYDLHHGRMMVRYQDGEWSVLEAAREGQAEATWNLCGEQLALEIMNTPASFTYEEKDGTVECTFTQALGNTPHKLTVVLDKGTLEVRSVTEID